MKKYNAEMQKVFILTCILLVHIFVSGQSTFQKTYKVGAAIEGANTFTSQQTADGGFIIGSYTFAAPSLVDIQLIKMNMTGGIEWVKSFDIGAGEMCRSLQQTSDGGFILTGQRNTTSINNYETYLFKTDSTGNFLWTKGYSITPSDDGWAVRQTNDGGYLIAGRTNLYTSSIGIFLIKADSIGNVQWAKKYNGQSIDWCTNARQTMDGGYVITGYMPDSSGTNFDALLIKTDNLGNILWSKTYGGADDEQIYDIEQLPDSGFIIIGETQSFHPGEIAYLIRTDASGNLIWSKGYAGSIGWKVQQTIDNGYVIIGYLASGSLFKTDSAGTFIWAKSFSGNFSTLTRTGQQTSDGGYFLAGTTNDSTGSIEIIYAAKTDSLGSTGCNSDLSITPVITATQIFSPILTVTAINPTVTVRSVFTGGGVTASTLCATGADELSEEKHISLFPNPASNELKISVPNLQMKNAELYNIYGQKVLSQLAKGQEQVIIDVSKLNAGIYFVEVRGENHEHIAKFVKQ